MHQQTIPTSSTPNVLIHAIPGDLRVAGWERNEILIKTDGDSLDVTAEADPIVIVCDEDLVVYLPRAANLTVESVAGDASLQAIQGPITLGPVAGDLTMHDVGPASLGEISGDANLRNIGALNAGSISGDLILRGGHGICAVDDVGGDASLRDVDGMVAIEDVGSDLYVRNVHGGVNVRTGSDAALYLVPVAGQKYDITAAGDLILCLPLDAQAKLHLESDSPDSIRVDFEGVQIPEDWENCEIIIGENASDMAEMLLSAGSDLLVTSQADRWEFASGFDSGEWGVPPMPPIPPLPPDFSERINRRVQAAMERAQVHMEDAGRRAEAAGRRAEATMRRAEAKARAAEVRARRGAQVNMNIGRWNWDLSPHGPAQAGEPISNDERLTILKMLQEKKISLDEAEQLLAALEGK